MSRESNYLKAKEKIHIVQLEHFAMFLANNSIKSREAAENASVNIAISAISVIDLLSPDYIVVV